MNGSAPSRGSGRPVPPRWRTRMSILLAVLLAGLAAWTLVPRYGISVTAEDDPWSVPASWTVVERDISFESDGFRLSGTLYSPEGVRNGPALVAVQQAGTDTRDNSLMVQMAQHLNAVGYSVLLYDRRGEGESEGGPERPSYAAMARDAVAAKHTIADTEEVHPDKIGFWGVSQGGWLAMEAAAMSSPAFVIVVGSPLTTPGEQMEVLAYNYLLVAGHGEEVADRALQIRKAVMDDYFRGELSHDSATALLAEVEDEPWFELAWLPAADDLPEDPEMSSWILEMDYDPVAAYEGVEAPMLFMLGGEDFDIPVERTLEIAEALDDRDEREIVVIPGASHVMRIEEDPADQFELEESDASNSTKYFFVMGEWLGRLGL